MSEKGRTDTKKNKKKTTRDKSMNEKRQEKQKNNEEERERKKRKSYDDYIITLAIPPLDCASNHLVEIRLGSKKLKLIQFLVDVSSPSLLSGTLPYPHCIAPQRISIRCAAHANGRKKVKKREKVAKDK